MRQCRPLANDNEANGVFTLPDTDTDTDIDADKMGLQLNCICVDIDVSVCVSVRQCEHLRTILYNPFFIGISVYVGQCEHSIMCTEASNDEITWGGAGSRPP